MEQLDKLELIVERTEANYEQAVEALKEADGDVELAVNYLQQEKQERSYRRQEKFEVKGEQLKGKVKDLVNQGNVTRLRITKDNRVLLDIPVTAGIVGIVLAPYLAAIGGIAAMVSKCSIEVERADKSHSVRAR
jgi:hypothetical protein